MIPYYCFCRQKPLRYTGLRSVRCAAAAWLRSAPQPVRCTAWAWLRSAPDQFVPALHHLGARCAEIGVAVLQRLSCTVIDQFGCASNTGQAVTTLSACINKVAAGTEWLVPHLGRKLWYPETWAVTITGSPAQPSHRLPDSVCTVFRLCCSTTSSCVRCFGSPAQPSHRLPDSVCTVFRLCCSTTSYAGLRVYGVSSLLLNKSPSAGLRVYGVSALLLNHLMCWTPCVRCFGSAAQPRHVLDSVCTVFRLSYSTTSCAGLRVYGVSALLPNHVMCWTPCVRCFGSPNQPSHRLLDSVCTVFRLSCSTKSCAELRVYGVSALLLTVYRTPCDGVSVPLFNQVIIC